MKSVRYALSFRWMIFAFIAMLGWLAVSIPILWVMALVGRPQFQPLLLIVIVPFAIWYLRRFARDKKEFDASRR